MRADDVFFAQHQRTLLLRAGLPFKVASERLGRTSPGFTLNVYQHVLPRRAG